MHKQWKTITKPFPSQEKTTNYHLKIKLQNKRKLLRFLKKVRATIYREIKRVKGEYCAEKA